ncbi:MAG TPA: O-methyltransferase [Bacilli bacterium]
MELEQMSLARQVDLVFREIKEELAYLSSGVVFIQIRNNIVGKFGIRHDPLEARNGELKHARKVLTEDHLEAFRKMGVGSLEHKKHWTHGEISYEFALRNNILQASVQFESNYIQARSYAV